MRAAKQKGDKMAWFDDKYIRNLLDARERWGTLLSLTAVSGLLLFLADHPHHSWVNLGPVAIGAFGSLFVLVVNCYYKQAEDFANARSKSDEEEVKRIKADGWHTYASHIGFLGLLNILAPIALGAIATLTLYWGILPAPAAN